MYGRFDLESFPGILERSSHMEVRLYFHQLFLRYQKVFNGVAQRPYPIYSMMSFPCFLFTSSK